MRFHVREQLGPKREITHQGYLLCRDVPIARTGDQIYGPGETPVEVGIDGRAVVARNADEVFRPEVMDSFNGVPFVVFLWDGDLSHPKDGAGEGIDVNPSNWKEYAAGMVFNVRRGRDTQDDLLLADILVKDSEAIRLITEEGKDELSCGYDAKYVDDGEGRGHQEGIRGNHVALVERGRCGWRCSVQDSIDAGRSKKTSFGGKMAKRGASIISKFRDSLTAAVAGADQATKDKLKLVLDEASEEDDNATAPEGDDKKENHIHINVGEGSSSTSDEAEKWSAMDARVKDLEAKFEGLKKTADAKAKDEGDPDEEEKDRKSAEQKKKDEEEAASTEDEAEEESGEKKARKAEDSSYFEDSFRMTVSNAEILAPGIAFPTFDHAAKPKATLDSLTEFRRKVLAIASSTPVAATALTELRAGRVLTGDALARMSGKEVRSLFHGAAAQVKLYNAAHAAVPATSRVADSSTTLLVAKTPADLNRINAEFWSKRS